ncbi:MAG: hypothetical protein ACK57B_13695, partial [Betaproteobacteria bacterium]
MITNPTPQGAGTAVVIGSGFGGLAAAIRRSVRGGGVQGRVRTSVGGAAEGLDGPAPGPLRLGWRAAPGQVEGARARAHPARG